MNTKILMPALSPTMTEGNLTKWLVKVGQKVKAGDIIAEIETDKATIEVEAVDEGNVEKLLFSEGAKNILVNSPIAILTNEIKEDDKKIVKEKKVLEKVEKKEEFNSNISSKTISSELKNNQKNLSEDTVTMRQAIRDTIAEEMRKDKNIFVLGVEIFFGIASL